MRNIKEIQNILISLTKNDLCEEYVNIIALPQSGSSRLYFRILTADHSYIGTYNSNIEENTAFFTFTNHFNECGLPVPMILAVNEEKDCYIQTDLGDDTLFRCVQNDILNGTLSDDTIKLYQKSLSYLVDFQLKGHYNLDYSVAYPTPCFDRNSIMDDLNYFRYYFLKVHTELVFNETRLYLDFQRLTDFILEAPAEFFMYRDFQTRNIMIYGNQPWFIDYQGGRKGPLQYDVVSLLYQVKAQLPDNVRENLLHHYKKQLERYLDVEMLQFDKYYQAFVMMRLMQVLGAYGYRGLIQKKLHFLESIPYALKEIIKQVDDWQLPFELPELRLVIKQFELLIPRYQVVEPKVLKVTINSFSYKNGGIPEDISGNGGGFVFDCRFLPNPGRLECFKKMTGCDKEVQDYLNEKTEVQEFRREAEAIITMSVENYLERGFKNLMVSFGCTGGQHRSVFFAEKTFEMLKERYPQIIIELNHIAQRKSIVHEP